MASYQLYTDGGARGNPGPAGIGFVIKEDGRTIKKVGQYIGAATNNQAEYQALILGLGTLLAQAADPSSSDLHVLMDSELITRQIQGSYQVKDKKLKPLFQKAVTLLAEFKAYKMEHIPRMLNSEADALVNEAVDKATLK
jgi:ribonuclease HI